MRVGLLIFLVSLIACDATGPGEGDDGGGGGEGGTGGAAPCPAEAPDSYDECPVTGTQCSYDGGYDECDQEVILDFECQGHIWVPIYDGFVEPQCTGGSGA